MKHLTIAGKFKALSAFCLLLLIQAVVLAQDTTSSSSTKSVTVTKETSDWFSNPWVWVIGAAVFILLLVALLGRGGGSSGRTDRTTVTKTIRTDTDTDL